MKNEEKENKNENKSKSMLDKIRSSKIAILLSDEERMKEAIEKMIKEAAIEKKLDSAYEKTAKKLKRGN